MTDEVQLLRALDDMAVPFMRIEGVAEILAAMETSGGALDPVHLGPLGDALHLAKKSVRKPYAVARYVSQPAEAG